MDRTLHDMRNDLAVAIGTIHALIDGKLDPTPGRLADILASLESLDAALITSRGTLSETTAPKEDLLNAVIEGSPYAKVLVNADGRIVLVNAQTEALFGYSRAELLGMSIDQLVPERFRRGHPELRDNFAAAPSARAMGAGRDLYGRRKDAGEVPIEIGLNPITTSGETFTLAAITDISERKRSEELRLEHLGVQQHAAELEELNRELADVSRFKTEFVSTMSHELRTPLGAIIGGAELLSRGKLDERAQITVQTIVEASEALLALINSVLDFSKIEAGKMELVVEPFEIEPVLEGAADVLAHLAREKNLTLNAYIDPSIPPVIGDRDRVRQILLNLLGNAVKFTESGRVVVRAVSVELSPEDVLVRFDVQDTGIGIPADVLPKLFEPFAQADRSASRKFAGTGLGLSISKRLVEMMGGEIGVDSIAGAGSSFWFIVRFARAADAAALQRRLPGGTASLIVSGDDTFAQIVESYLESWSMKSRRARSGDDVVAGLRGDGNVSWVAIVDLDNTGAVDVSSTVEILRSIAPSRVIAIGHDGALSKPVRQSQLFDAIVKAVDLPPPHAPGAPPPAPATAATATSGTILVAEDNERLRRLLQMQFDDLGVPVTFVSDGREALEAVRRQNYAMVFMDCQMPNLDGLDATKLIRHEEQLTGRHLPITAMTANAFAEDRAACLAAGMDDYLSKPVKLADLRAKIERWAAKDEGSTRS
ncbi:MAG TPA: ATP-binding protein [Candidatus Lustribacter sp.]|nr:ATP-binding protein [Candidatus Lustribacter sp.]